MADSPVFEQEDMKKNKVFGVLGFLIPILFFLPLVVNKDSKYGRFIANQQLVMLILGVILGVLSSVLAFTYVVPIVLELVDLVLVVLGIVNVVKENGQELPVVGKITLIK